MVRPEPHQAFDKTEFGADRGIEPRFRFIVKELLRQRRLAAEPVRYRRRLLVCGIVRNRRDAGHARRLPAIEKACGIVGFGLLLRTQRELLLRCLFGPKVEHRAGGLGAGRQIGGDDSRPRTVQIGKQGALRVGGNGGDRFAAGPKPNRCKASAAASLPRAVTTNPPGTKRVAAL